MDTITHGIVGALAGKALSAGRDVPARSADGSPLSAESSSTARVAIISCTIGSIFPDIDMFAGPLARNPLAIMEWHRNITHSLVILPLWAALLATASLPVAGWLGLKRPSFSRLLAIYAAGLATHVFLDLVTSFGTRVWSPLGYSRVAWDWLFILDLSLTSIALVPQLAAWCYREPHSWARRAALVWTALTVGAFGGYALAAAAGYGFPLGIVGVASAGFALVLVVPAIRDTGFRWTRGNWCRMGLALVCAYLAFAFLMHRKALADVDDFAIAHHVRGESRAAIPLPPTATHWTGLVRTPDGVWRTTFHEPGGNIERAQFYSDQQSDPHAQDAKKLRDVQVYLWFARFPLWQVTQQGERTIVDISDVRFFREDGPLASSESWRSMPLIGIRTNPSGFTFEIVFNRDGQVVSSGFKKLQ